MMIWVDWGAVATVQSSGGVVALQAAPFVVVLERRKIYQLGVR